MTRAEKLSIASMMTPRGRWTAPRPPCRVTGISTCMDRADFRMPTSVEVVSPPPATDPDVPAGREPTITEAAARWAEQLERWAIPEEVLAQAPVSPWQHDTAMFVVDDTLDRNALAAEIARGAPCERRLGTRRGVRRRTCRDVARSARRAGDRCRPEPSDARRVHTRRRGGRGMVDDRRRSLARGRDRHTRRRRGRVPPRRLQRRRHRAVPARADRTRTTRRRARAATAPPAVGLERRVAPLLGTRTPDRTDHRRPRRGTRRTRPRRRTMGRAAPTARQSHRRHRLACGRHAAGCA